MASKPWKTKRTIRHKGEWVTVEVAVTVDWDRLAQHMAESAMRNKSHKSQLRSNMIRGAVSVDPT